MRTEPLIDQLASDLKPVRRRTVWGDALLLLGLCAAEIALFLSLGMLRDDMPMAMHQPSFWWKLTSLGMIAAVSGCVAVLSLDPLRSPRRGLALVAALFGLSLAAGWLLDASRDGLANLIVRLNWISGVQCVGKMVALSIPPVAAFCILMKRGAPIDRGGTAMASGAAAAAWGAFVFVFACPFEDPLYITVWYSLGCSLVTLFARLVLPRIARW
ncbi:DUF1109 domain-containing protein [Hansschlegelia sp.]|uniref:DUF1109 domain-containing protein n=1 Tax=Hansschlegelia sp. TaxID=2041892 RepID=UPI002CF485A5|nr:DUF1109 domain-containing protein [Hansschlegelia sp.]HVI27900.1 DUF1109 domain-containing protein [Hansschlegelia sp.]